MTVSGTLQPDGSILALTITFTGAITTLSGQILSIAAPNFVVGGQTVTVNSSTAITANGVPKTFSDLLVGSSVTVSGRLQLDGSILALTITLP